MLQYKVRHDDFYEAAAALEEAATKIEAAGLAQEVPAPEVLRQLAELFRRKAEEAILN